MEEEIINIREVSFSTLNYVVTIRSNDENDSLSFLKESAINVLKEIMECERNE